MKGKAYESYLKKEGLCAHPYSPTKEEKKAYDYCVDNGIIISPVAAQPGMMPKEWYVGISTPDNFRKVYKSRFKYNNEQIWQECYTSALYYYNKK